MNNATNHSVKTVFWITSINFTLFNIIQNILDYYLPKLSDGIFKVVVVVIVSEFLYFTISFLVKFCIDKYYIPLKSKKKFKLEGKWYHIHIPHFLNNIDDGRHNLSCGTTIIRRDLYDFSFEAQNFSYSVTVCHDVNVVSLRIETLLSVTL